MANSASLSAILSAILSARIEFPAPGEAMVGVGSLSVKHGTNRRFYEATGNRVLSTFTGRVDSGESRFETW